VTGSVTPEHAEPPQRFDQEGTRVAPTPDLLAITLQVDPKKVE